MRTVRQHKIIIPSTKSHSIYNPDSQQSKYDDQELRAMQRSPKRNKPTTSLFSLLTEHLFWGNFDRR